MPVELLSESFRRSRALIIPHLYQSYYLGTALGYCHGYYLSVHSELSISKIVLINVTLLIKFKHNIQNLWYSPWVVVPFSKYELILIWLFQVNLCIFDFKLSFRLFSRPISYPAHIYYLSDWFLLCLYFLCEMFGGNNWMGAGSYFSTYIIMVEIHILPTLSSVINWLFAK